MQSEAKILLPLLPKITEPQSVYLENMKVLWDHAPELAQQVDMVDTRDFIECVPSRTGMPTCRLTGVKGQAVYMHSRYDPLREAQRWADKVMEQAAAQQDDKSGRLAMCYVVDGFGLGYHVRALFEMLSGEAFIVVCERNIAMLRTALELSDYSEMFASERIILLNKSDRQEIFNKLQGRATAMMLGVIFTRSMQQVDVEFRSKVHKLISEYASFMRSHLISLLANSIITCKNIMYNLPAYVSTNPINTLKGRFKGYPAVVVSAGPSLQRNIEQLKQIRDKVVIIAVQTTLKPLLERGIVPDFVTSLDYHEVSKRFFTDIEDEKLKQVHLVAEPKASWHVIDYVWKRGPVSLLGNEFAGMILHEMDDEHDNLPAGATVAHLSFYLAEYIGAEPVIFLGQDLAFSDNVYYSPGTALHDIWRPELGRFCSIEMKEWERIVRSRSMLRKVEDIYGQQIYTDEQMFTYLQQFEKDFARSTTRIIDATEGGARKQFCEVMTLRQAAKEFCDRPVCWDKCRYEKIAGCADIDKLKRARELVQKRIEQVQELKDITVQTIDVVKEMLGLIDNQAELNRKMVRLDELRTMVKQRQMIYRMVMYVSQVGEMFRFRRDRAIELSKAEGKEKQRQQLRRDMGYVTEVRNGCERLEAMLEECLKRFDKEIDVNEQ